MTARRARYPGALLACCAAALLLTACDSTRDTYRHYADTLSNGGKLRTERAPLDASFTNSRLAENFDQIDLPQNSLRDFTRIVPFISQIAIKIVVRFIEVVSHFL